MKIIIYLSCPGKCYLGGQTGIGATHPGTFATLGRGFKMNHLMSGMHAGIVTPGTEQLHRVVRHCSHIAPTASVPPRLYEIRADDILSLNSGDMAWEIARCKNAVY